jgi:glyoxylase-like metal-dependent hydrolase (beta-lactamase superfamily II)
VSEPLPSLPAAPEPPAFLVSKWILLGGGHEAPEVYCLPVARAANRVAWDLPIAGEEHLALSRELVAVAEAPALSPGMCAVRFYASFLQGHDDVSRRPELRGGEWLSASRGVEKWEEGTALLEWPLPALMRALSSGGRGPMAVARGLGQSLQGLTWAEWQKDIRCLPLRTETLPPATHTHCYLLGSGECLVVDPAVAGGEGEKLARALARLSRDEGLTAAAVFLTHHHSDHALAAREWSKRLGVPILCHEQTARKLGLTDFTRIEEGQRLPFSGASAGRFEALFTPGHAEGHLCLLDRQTGAAVVGDMVAGVGTILINPPEGNMAEYLRQLQRLRERKPAALFPSHGPFILDGQAKLEEYVAHRQAREEKLLRCIPAEGISLEALARRAYDELPESHLPLAERSALAILEKLGQEGLVLRQGDTFCRKA